MLCLYVMFKKVYIKFIQIKVNAYSVWPTELSFRILKFRIINIVSRYLPNQFFQLCLITKKKFSFKIFYISPEDK